MKINLDLFIDTVGDDTFEKNKSTKPKNFNKKDEKRFKKSKFTKPLSGKRE